MRIMISRPLFTISDAKTPFPGRIIRSFCPFVRERVESSPRFLSASASVFVLKS